MPFCKLYSDSILFLTESAIKSSTPLLGQYPPHSNMHARVFTFSVDFLLITRAALETPLVTYNRCAHTYILYAMHVLINRVVQL